MKTKEFMREVEIELSLLYARIGCDIPGNHNDILAFVADDVAETADPDEWHNGDVAIAFRHWMESKSE